MDIKDDLLLFDKYMELINGGIMYDNFVDKSSEDNKEFIIFRTVNFRTQLLQFTKAYTYIKFAHFCRNTVLEEKLKIYIANKKITKGDVKMTKELKKILIDNGIVEIIRDFKNEIDKKIEFLEAKLKNEDNKTDKLLGL
nr:hypothetical protein [Flavobacterium panacagri]